MRVHISRTRPRRRHRQTRSVWWRQIVRRTRTKAGHLAQEAAKNWRNYHTVNARDFGETTGRRLREDLKLKHLQPPKRTNPQRAAQRQRTNPQQQRRPAAARPAPTTTGRRPIVTDTTATGQAMLPEGKAITKAGGAMAVWLPADAKDIYDQAVTIARAIAILGGQLTGYAETLASMGVDRRVLDLMFVGAAGVAQSSAPYVQACRKFAELYRGDLQQAESPARQIKYPAAA